ncbi:Wadjet anti-phage system protein JetD domain-containing protein [Dethiothermospora halolimnae]|uniref:Wadjet anti-phage system protein JetD domain-containing protein n=1 Tax=Dethiothermospora halolimnae TaxID=3114390 RepID=UPI003CCC248B
MDKKICSYLENRKKKTIYLTELAKLFPGNINYDEFFTNIKKLEEVDILIPVKSHGTNNKNNPLYNTYRINKGYFRQQLIDEIQNFKLRLHSDIDLNSYLSLNKKELKKDLPYIKIVDKYLKEKGLPTKEVSSPERSYEIIGDEKWIDEKGGRRFLRRINLYEKLKISYKNDPLMFAINPKELDKKEHKHMIVENKATFHLFLDVLNITDFTSLIYGGGWKIVSNIVMLEKQLGLSSCKHILYYFGDMDYEGISIWSGLNGKRKTYLALEFYRELLKIKPSKGKESQRKNDRALDKFLQNFNDDEKLNIKKLLKDKKYYPQEALNKEVVEKIWRNI